MTRHERRRENLTKRNAAIIARYYYHSELQRTRFDDSIRTTADEFYIDVTTALRIVNAGNEMLNTMIVKRVSAAELRREFVQFLF